MNKQHHFVLVYATEGWELDFDKALKRYGSHLGDA
jgi:hypothetical protein